MQYKLTGGNLALCFFFLPGILVEPISSPLFSSFSLGAPQVLLSPPPPPAAIATSDYVTLAKYPAL